MPIPDVIRARMIKDRRLSGDELALDQVLDERRVAGNDEIDWMVHTSKAPPRLKPDGAGMGRTDFPHLLVVERYPLAQDQDRWTAVFSDIDGTALQQAPHALNLVVVGLPRDRRFARVELVGRGRPLLVDISIELGPVCLRGG